MHCISSLIFIYCANIQKNFFVATEVKFYDIVQTLFFGRGNALVSEIRFYIVFRARSGENGACLINRSESKACQHNWTAYAPCWEFMCDFALHKESGVLGHAGRFILILALYVCLIGLLKSLETELELNINSQKKIEFD